MSRRIRCGVFVGVVIAFLAPAGTVLAENDETSKDLSRWSAALEADLQRQEAAMEDEFGELSRVGSRLEEAQTRAADAGARVDDLKRETRSLNRSLETRKRDAAESRLRVEERLTAIYKGQELDGILLLLEGLAGGDSTGDAALNQVATRMLVGDRESMMGYRKDRRLLGDTIRQLQGKNAEYKESREQHQAKVEELGRRETDLERSIEGLREEQDQTKVRLDDLEQRIKELEARKRAGLLDPPASGGGDHPEEEEARIAREEIAAESVEELPLSRYRQLYRQAARDYGFGPDWYVLMAIGKLESNHGENMGPSSSGALGQMQFMPSTWEFAGVDGDGDGVANIMDPEDAIPAAAKYLAAGGAPGDWYAALYTYNNAGWYVREVLEVAEGYRLLAGDNSVGPYGTASAPATSSTASDAEEPPAPSGEPPKEDAPERAAPSAKDTTLSSHQY